MPLTVLEGSYCDGAITVACCAGDVVEDMCAVTGEYAE